MITLEVLDECSPLLEVILGSPESFGGIPKKDNIYDPKTLLNVKNGTYPLEEAIKKELDAFHHVLMDYDVKIYRPKVYKSVESNICSRYRNGYWGSVFIATNPR